MWTAVSSHPVRKAWRSQKSFLLHLLIKCRRKEISDNFKLLISLMWHKLLLFVMAYENSLTLVEFFNSQAEKHAKSNIRNVGWNSSLPFTDLVWHSLNLSFSCVCGAHEGQNRAQIVSCWTWRANRLGQWPGQPVSEPPASAVHLNPTAWGGELQRCAVMLVFKWAPGLELRSSGFTVHTLIHWEIALAPQLPFKNIIRYLLL